MEITDELWLGPKLPETHGLHDVTINPELEWAASLSLHSLEYVRLSLPQTTRLSLHSHNASGVSYMIKNCYCSSTFTVTRYWIMAPSHGYILTVGSRSALSLHIRPEPQMPISGLKGRFNLGSLHRFPSPAAQIKQQLHLSRTYKHNTASVTSITDIDI